ncbi:MAG TPA: RHS repeat-associated core domain-containing protein, partial [Thermoleophilia bacterium]|nr:RHS repeat-associated core domain-containing protein [Thermoleophilia bacterium]
GVYTTASGRTINLSDAFDHGRLSYVTHPAGATFFSYDAAGRIMTRVQYEGALPATPPANGAAMRAVDHGYAADGTLAQMRYPSNRLVTYLYGDDKRAPERVLLSLDTSAPQRSFELVGDVAVDVDGMATRWSWRLPDDSLGLVTITKDGLGRIVTMVTRTGQLELVRTLSYSYDEDGDVTEQLDTSYPSSLPGGVDSVPHDEHAYRDLLTRWYGFVPWAEGVASDVAVAEVDALGRRRRMTNRPLAGGAEVEVSFAYHPTFPERLTTVRRLGSSPLPSLSTVASFGYDGIGQVTSVAYGLARTQTLEYGPRGNVVVTTNASGTSEHVYADTMERWRRNGPVFGFAERFRYGIGGELIDDELSGRSTRPPIAAGKTSVRDEFVYLGGRKIAVVHSETRLRTPQVAMLTTDRLGTVRRMTTRDARALAHIDTDAWGNGVTRDDRSSPGVGQLPNVGERLPGQYADGGRGFTPLENHWRFYLPWTAGYLSPDAEYRAGVSAAVGPQAYAYASARPLVNVDPTGTVSFDRSSAVGLCKLGKCDNYEPEPMRTQGLVSAEAPACKTWWSRAFPAGPSLRELLWGTRPNVYFAPRSLIGSGGRTLGDQVVLACERADCSTYEKAVVSSNLLIHELVHTAQHRNLIFGFHLESDPIMGADAGFDACARFE